MGKLKIIGWTTYDSSCQNIIVTPKNNAEILGLIAGKIIEDKLLFTGDQHQDNNLNCVPVFNNGKCFRASYRTIAMLMSVAYHGNARSYMDYYMISESSITPSFPFIIAKESDFKYDEGQDEVLPIIIGEDQDLIYSSINNNISLLTFDKAIIANYNYLLKQKNN